LRSRSASLGRPFDCAEIENSFRPASESEAEPLVDLIAGKVGRFHAAILAGRPKAPSPVLAAHKKRPAALPGVLNWP